MNSPSAFSSSKKKRLQGQLLPAEHAAKPITQPQPSEPSDIERCAVRIWRGGPGKLGIEVCGKVRNEAAAEVLGHARARELGERALKAVFDDDGHPGLIVALRGEAIDDVALRARAGACVAAGAAD